MSIKVAERLKKAKWSPLVSVEALPPHKGGSIDAVFGSLDPLMEFKPPLIDVTYHREEFIYRKRPGGISKNRIRCQIRVKLRGSLLRH